MSNIIKPFINFIAEVDPGHSVASIVSLKKAIQVLVKLKDAESQPLAKSLDKLFNLHIFLMEHIDEINFQDVTNFYNLQVQVASIYPKIVDKVKCKKLIIWSIDILCKISDEATDAWKDPPQAFIQSYNMNTVDMPRMKQLKNSVDSLAQVISQKNELVQFQNIFHQCISDTSNWRPPFAAIIIVSRLRDVITNIQDLAPYINQAIRLLEHNHPKIRYAALQLLGQYSDNKSQDIQQNYFDDLMPKLIKLLMDPIPRVVSHALGCLTNVLQYSANTIRIQKYMIQLLNSIFHCLQSDKTWMKQSALRLLSAICGWKRVLGPSLSKVIDTLQLILTSSSTNLSNPFSIKQMSESVVVLAVLFCNQNKQIVKTYIPLFVSFLIDHKEHIQLSSLLTSWSLLSEQYDSLLDVNQIYLFLISKVPLVIQMDDQNPAIDLLKCLINISKSQKCKVKKYKNQILNIYHQVFNRKSLPQGIRSQTVQLLTNYLKNIRPQGKKTTLQYNNLINETIRSYIFSLQIMLKIDQFGQKQYSLQYLVQAKQRFMGIKEMVGQAMKTWKKKQCQKFMNKLLYLADEIKKIYWLITDVNHYEQEKCQEQIESHSREYKQNQEYIRKLVRAVDVIPQIFEQLIKVDKKHIKNYVVTFLITLLGQSQFQQIKQFKSFDLSLAILLIEYCSYQQIYYSSQLIVQLIQKQVYDPSPNIRNRSVFGLGVISMKFIQVTQDTIRRRLEMLFQSKDTPYDQILTDQSQIRFCDDNVVSAIGKLLKFWGLIYPNLLKYQIYKKWCSFLPLNEDKVQADIQQQYLIQLLENNPTLLIRDASDLNMVMKIFIKFVADKQHSNNLQIITATVNVLKRMTKQSWFIQWESQMKNSLSTSELNSLSKLINS